MPFDIGSAAGYITPRDNSAAGCYSSRNHLCPGAFRFQKNLRACIQGTARRSYQNAVEPDNSILAHTTGYGIHLERAHWLHTDVITDKNSVFFYYGAAARPDGYFRSPVMNHGKGQLRPFFDVELRYADVQPRSTHRAGSTACDYVQLRVLLGNDNVMHLLRYITMCQIQTCLKRIDSLNTRKRPDKITVVQI